MTKKKTTTKTEKAKARGSNGAGKQIVELPELGLKRVDVTIEGDAPLLVHNWDEKTRREMLEKQMGKAQTGREAKDPRASYLGCLYWLDEKKTKTGFPARGIKKALGDAGYRFVRGAKGKKEFFQAIQIPVEFVEVIGKHEMHESMVRVGRGSADIRFRAIYPKWSMVVPVRYSEAVMTLDVLVGLFECAGFGVGIGENRPEKGGCFGMFHVAAVKEMRK